MSRASSRLAHPTRPMSAGMEGVQEFTITHQARPNCLLMRSYFNDNKFLTYASAYVTTYKVLKMEDKSKKGKPKQLVFYVIHGPDNFSEDQGRRSRITGRKLKSKPRPIDPRSHKYIGQIAWAKCSSGNIDDITVKSKPRDARQCGIATVLTELCLLDPDVYQDGKSSDAYNVLRSNGIDTKCEQAVAMDMVAEPLSGAYAYFSAASRIGYNKLIVNWPYLAFDRISVYVTDHAKRSYNVNTGIIEPCIKCGNNEQPCEANLATWVFCKEKASSK